MIYEVIQIYIADIITVIKEKILTILQALINSIPIKEKKNSLINFVLLFLKKILKII